MYIWYGSNFILTPEYYKHDHDQTWPLRSPSSELVYIDPTMHMFTKAYCQPINLSPLPDIDGKNEF